jgi:hypothetical protein
MKSLTSIKIAGIVSLMFFIASISFAGDKHTSKLFQGAKANTGTVTHWKDGDKDLLTFSDDFKTPETPDPHVQIVDSKGNVYLLNRCMIKESMESKENKFNKTIPVPAYIKDIAKVQIWCAWAETLLGEAEFESTIQLTSK